MEVLRGAHSVSCALKDAQGQAGDEALHTTSELGFPQKAGSRWSSWTGSRLSEEQQKEEAWKRKAGI